MFFLGTLIISFSYLCILAYYYYAELLYKKKIPGSWVGAVQLLDDRYIVRIAGNGPLDLETYLFTISLTMILRKPSTFYETKDFRIRLDYVQLHRLDKCGSTCGIAKHVAATLVPSLVSSI